MSVEFRCSDCERTWSVRDPGSRSESQCFQCDGMGYRVGLGRFECEAVSDKKVDKDVEFTCNGCKLTWKVVRTPDTPFSSRCLGCLGMGYRVGIGHYVCDCSHRFVGVAAENVRSRCYECDDHPLPDFMSEFRHIHKTSENKHSCSQCRSNGTCPLVERARRQGALPRAAWFDFDSDSDDEDDEESDYEDSEDDEYW